jgi:hypothetical protein
MNNDQLRMPLLAILTFVLINGSVATTVSAANSAVELAIIENVKFQPFAAATRRLIEALDYAGAPLSAEEKTAVEKALEGKDPAADIAFVQKTLDARCLLLVHINPESRVKVHAGPAPKELLQQGWRTFLVKVHNEPGVTAELVAESPNATPVYTRSTNRPEVPDEEVATPGEILDRFLSIAMISREPIAKTLSGLVLEYRIMQLYSRDKGPLEAKLLFNVGQGTQDLGFRNEKSILFKAKPAVKVTFDITDFDGSPTTASLIIKDDQRRVYPNPSRRLSPDFFFHEQVYRHSGESVSLSSGRYHVEYGRGPEYLIQKRTIDVPDAAEHRVTLQLERWIHAAGQNWWSGDHHIHAAGCAHYESPTQGVFPEAMMRHILGEDLNVGCILTWGPCWYFQKEFFGGKVHELSQEKYIMRYDVEVSGFPSGHAGHLTLLRLTEDDFSGTRKIEDWPSWDLPILQWAKAQNAVVGFSHSGWGLKVPGDELPNYNMAPFDGIGANEFIVDVVHDAVDFISTVDTPVIWELNIWYHTLNCGFRTRVSGETDFPCIYGEKVGLGRSYVKMTREEGKQLDYDTWAYGIRDGRSYVSDGKSHLMDLVVGGVPVGEKGPGGVVSELDIAAPGKVRVTARVAAYLPEEARPDIKSRPLEEKPYWDLERARIDDSRLVPVELLVNGEAVETRKMLADGKMHFFEFEPQINQSSWVALRVFPSSHTNPVFVVVDKKPVRANRRSAEWCRKAVDVCWKNKMPRIREEEREAAKQAYDKARAVYDQIISESAD